jgi:hypothetical protein
MKSGSERVKQSQCHNSSVFKHWTFHTENSRGHAGVYNSVTKSIKMAARHLFWSQRIKPVGTTWTLAYNFISFIASILIPLSVVGTVCFYHVVIKIRQLFFTSYPPRLPRLLKYFSSISYMLYTNKSFSWITLSIKNCTKKTASKSVK